MGFFGGEVEEGACCAEDGDQGDPAESGQCASPFGRFGWESVLGFDGAEGAGGGE